MPTTTVKLNPADWTLAGTGGADFLIQNRGAYGIEIHFGATPPVAESLDSVTLKPGWTISNVGTDNAYGKGEGKVVVVT